MRAHADVAPGTQLLPLGGDTSQSAEVGLESRAAQQGSRRAAWTPVDHLHQPFYVEGKVFELCRQVHSSTTDPPESHPEHHGSRSAILGEGHESKVYGEASLAERDVR